ncbi:hypothetical protein S40288_03882 [Stachybotrys chartarum IBT 40288]|nr:hypothetical protein S40288_03882 [Stachybotrys chartarum IBT 40288]
MSEPHSSRPNWGARQMNPPPPMYEGQNPSSLPLLQPREESIAPFHEPIAAPVSRGWTTLSHMLTSCCGFEDVQGGSYHAVPNTSFEDYGPSGQYMAEKVPTVGLLLEAPRDPKTEANNIDLSPDTNSAFVSEPVGFSTQARMPSSVVTNHQPSPLTTHPYNGSLLPLSHTVKHEPRYSDQPPPLMQFVGSGGVTPYQNQPMALDMPAVPPYQSEVNAVVPQTTLQNTKPWSVEPWGDATLVKSDFTGFRGYLASDLDPAFNSRGGKRGPFKDHKLREETALTRKFGSCVRCRLQRVRCENGPDGFEAACLTCLKVSNTKMGHFPCLRYKITDVKMYKPGQVPGYEWTLRWSKNITEPVQKWISPEIKIIRISEGFSRRTLNLEVREFQPQHGDKLERTWYSNGQQKSVKIPPYALVSLDEVSTAYLRYICDSMVEAMPRFLGHQNGLVYRTYKQAWALCKNPQSISQESLALLRVTFELWMSIRCSTASAFIVGDETLGMTSEILDESSPNHGMIPIPPVLGAQLDVILIHHIQTKLRRILLDRLQKLILKNKTANWLVVYLVTFMLLHNAALITAHDAKYARKHGMNRRFARQKTVKEYHNGANILLAYYHYCNKGALPFSSECSDQTLRNLAQLNQDQIRFVHYTRKMVAAHKQHWQELQEAHAYEDDLFYISELYEKDWLPRNMVLTD